MIAIDTDPLLVALGVSAAAGWTLAGLQARSPIIPAVAAWHIVQALVLIAWYASGLAHG